MYYTDIANLELQYFHNLTVHNFTVKLSQVLTSPLFEVEEVIADSIYKIYPLFYTNEITSSNVNDRVLENKLIICQKTENETFLTFKSDTGEIKDYSAYGDYYAIGDALNTSEFNAYISLLRQNVTHTDGIRINEVVDGVYGAYEFDISDTTVLDNGIVITDETIMAQPRVRLINPVFSSSKYILQLKILHYTGVNILDDETDDYKVVDALEIELTPDQWVDIPVEDLEQDYIIDLDCIVLIDHTAPVIQDYPTWINLTANKNIIQSGEEVDLIVEVKDNVKGLSNVAVYFYEEYEPTYLNLTGDKTIIQSGEIADLTARLKDEDGSLIKGEEIYFYIYEEE